jgi:serine/threonine-protein kinase
VIRIRLPRGEWFFDEARRLGRPGGFGEVFEGQDASGAPVAVKRLKLSAAEAAHRELRIADDLAGRSLLNVMAVLDSGQDAESGGYFVVMPRAERSLADEVRQRGPFSDAVTAEILLQIALGLEELRELVHRDLKPDNVLFHEGHWKIADFGIARFIEDSTSLNTLKGYVTPAFAAPEQWRSEHATGATDVYALGCIAYMLLTGAPPFPGPNSPDFQQQHLCDAPPPLPATEPRLRALIAACLRKPPTGRPSIERVRSVVSEISATAGVPADSINALRAANAIEVERVSREIAAAEQETRTQEERSAIVAQGVEILKALMREFKAVAEANATEVRCSLTDDMPSPGRGRPNLPIPKNHPNNRTVLSIRIGRAALELSLKHGCPEGTASDVLVCGEIHVRHDLHPPESVGSRLYYLRTDGAARWYEQSASEGFLPIDDESATAFIERWLLRLATLYHTHA